MNRTTTLAAVLCLALVPAVGRADDQKHFPTPEAAMKAIVAAAKSGSAEQLSAILGPGSREIVSSGDPVDDAAALKRFASAAAARTRLERADDGKTAIAHVGHDDWPLPIPLVHDDAGWRFDTQAGKEELLNRRIGRNELTVIEVARAYVDAQNEYAARFKTFAQKFRSTPGQRDGLYWEASDREVSPLGPLVASATTEGYHQAEPGQAPAPYHGYFFRILTKQGPHAPGGAKDYVKDGKMTGGFALVAWPAEHGSSGVMTFLVGRDDVVFQKDLGDATAETAKAMDSYDPDDSWMPTR